MWVEPPPSHVGESECQESGPPLARAWSEGDVGALSIEGAMARADVSVENPRISLLEREARCEH